MPFGGLLKATRNIANAFEWVGELGTASEANGLHFMRNRFYDNSTARFTSQDPIRLAGGDLNSYRYVFNNPLTFNDPSGLGPRIELGDRSDFHPDNGPTPTVIKVIVGGGAIAVGVVVTAPAWAPWVTGVLLTAPFNPYVDFILGGLLAINPTPYSPTGSLAGERGYAWTLIANHLGFFDLTSWETAAQKILVPIFAVISDPNQKLALAGVGARGYIEAAALIPYRIEFENESKATAPAQTVFVTDRLSSSLDWQAFELTEIGFGDERIILPPQTQHFETNLPVTINGAGFVVHIQAGIRWDTGEVSCTFRSLDPLTELPPPLQTGFLPPEDGTGRGQGFVSFVVRPKAELPTGTEIRNVALIDFDNGELIATDQVAPHDPAQGIDPNKQARVTIDAGAPSSSMALLPSASGPSLLLQWSGHDDLGGSGIASYDIYASTNGGPFGPWRVGTTNTFATFSGTVGSTYAYYSIARDYAGNTEKPPTSGQTSTTVGNPPSLVTLEATLVQTGIGSQVKLTYPVQPGKNYTVEYRGDLGPVDSWQPLPNGPHNSGSVSETNLVNQRYYHVRVQ